MVASAATGFGGSIVIIVTAFVVTAFVVTAFSENFGPNLGPFLFVDVVVGIELEHVQVSIVRCSGTVVVGVVVVQTNFKSNLIVGFDQIQFRWDGWITRWFSESGFAQG